MKIKFFKKRNSFKRKSFTLNPNLYWKLAVFSTFVIIITSFFFGYYMFKNINTDSPAPIANNGEQIPTVNTDRVTKVLNYFTIRQQKSNDIINSPSPVVDPSL